MQIAYWAIGAIIAQFGAILGVYILFFKHSSDGEHHPDSKKIIFKPYCEQREKTNKEQHARLNDCIEDEVKRQGEHFEQLKEGIAELKREAKEDLCELKRMIIEKLK